MAVTLEERRATSRIVMVRHGQTEWSLSGQHTSVTDLPLTAAGEEEARRVGRALRSREFGLTLSSPRQRALRSAELAGYADVVQVDPNLVEWDYGAYEGLTTKEIVAQRGSRWDLWADGVPPGAAPGASPGETAAEVQVRARAVIARSMPELDAGRTVLLIAHAHILRAIAVAWVDLPARDGTIFALSTSTVSELGFEHERHAILKWNAPVSP